MNNFFSKINKPDTNSTYHNPYKFLTTESYSEKKSTRVGDFETTLWMETAGLTVFMSLVVLVPTFF
ncbi:MAG: hypothetical protein HKN83_01460 [Gammaproteobacteria bacterium]|nr:hypothetical protein [Gammaproteobacteria bacterium]